MTHLDDYIKCIQHNNLTHPACFDSNPQVCGLRFGQVEENRYTECRHVLWNGRYGNEELNNTDASLQPSLSNRTANDNLRSRYADYFRCLSTMRAKVDEQCAPLLLRACRQRSLHVVKATRASMRSVGVLLERRWAAGDRNLRVVHAYRDPRAVAASRHSQGDPLLGKYAAFVVDTDRDESIIREARMYCRTAADDFRYRERELDRRYPGVVVSLDFDSSVHDITGTVNSTYHFVGYRRVPPPVSRWANDVAAKSRTMAERWRSHVSLELNDRIMALNECVELCRYIGCR